MGEIPSGIALKVERARHHLSDLRKAVNKLTGHLDAHGIVRHTDPDTGAKVWNVNAPVEVTDEIAVLAGDFVHNLRSALDHIAWHLASNKLQRPLLEFPIYESPGTGRNGFHEAGIAKIWSLPIEAKVVIERMQPYQGGNEPLLDIQRLDAIDKHRRLITTPYVIVRAGLTPPSGKGVAELPEAALKSGRYKHGDEILRATPDIPANSGKLEKMKLKGAFQIALEEEGVSGEVISKLSNLHKFVAEVVLPQFGPFF